MESREIVRRAIEFDSPPRLPFFIGSFWCDELNAGADEFPNDVCDSWEMDRQEAGWYFDNAAPDDWGCGWEATEVKNMGQVVSHPLEDWSKLDSYKPPNPRNPFYFKRVEEEIKDAGDRYVVITSHFNLNERLEMLHGFARTLEDYYLEPEKIHRTLDMILEYKIAHIEGAAALVRTQRSDGSWDMRYGGDVRKATRDQECQRKLLQVLEERLTLEHEKLLKRR